MIDHPLSNRSARRRGALHPRRLPDLEPPRLDGGQHLRRAAIRVNRGDIVCVAGSITSVAQFIRAVGIADRAQSVTEIFLVGFTTLIGALVLPAGGVPITLSTSGGALVAGILVGWLRTVKPQINNIPRPTLWFVNSVSLNVFIAIVGLSSGRTFIAGLREAGFGLFFWGLFATSVPMLLAPYIGKYLFRFDDAINLGCCGDARTSMASGAMAAESDVPMVGYPGALHCQKPSADPLGPRDRVAGHGTRPRDSDGRSRRGRPRSRDAREWS